MFGRLRVCCCSYAPNCSQSRRLQIKLDFLPLELRRLCHESKCAALSCRTHRRAPSSNMQGLRACSRRPADSHRLAIFLCCIRSPSRLYTKPVRPLSWLCSMHNTLFHHLPQSSTVPHVSRLVFWTLGAEEEQREFCSSHEYRQSLSDGRLDVGTHLPLMAKRYAYLGLIGEGTSAQVHRTQIILPRQLSTACRLALPAFPR